ncbi:MAG TPA: hypothetical protein VK843_00560 [Planctomycetota bacterium]|nr:hypothetical protein [Planctomycetota bacterium]
MLLEMGDQLAAGQYLWLSGTRHGEYEAAIAVFLARHQARHWTSLIGQLPLCARRTPVERLPPQVLATLRERGYPDAPSSVTVNAATLREERIAEERRGCSVPVALLLLVLVLLCLGVYQLFELVMSWVQGK